MSAERYYYRDGLKTVGPLSRSIILKLYANRNVRRDTVARQESSSDWVLVEALFDEEELANIDQRHRGANGRAALCLLWCVAAWFCWIGYSPVHLSLAQFLYFGVLLILTGVFVVIAARFSRRVFGEVRSVMPKYLSRAFCVFNLLVGSLYVIAGVLLMATVGYAFSWGHHRHWDWVTGERLRAPAEPIVSVAQLPWDLPLQPSQSPGIMPTAGAPSGSTIVLPRIFNVGEPYDWRTIPEQEMNFEGGFNWRELGNPGTGGADE